MPGVPKDTICGTWQRTQENPPVDRVRRGFSKAVVLTVYLGEGVVRTL